MSPVACMTALLLALPMPLAQEPDCTECVTLPALTTVQIELLASVSSEKSRTGERVPIRLAQPILIDRREAIPAGTMGVAEIVHAKKSGYGGTPGELVIAARYLDVAGQSLKLRSLRAAQSGQSRILEANLAVAMGMVPPHGGPLVIPAGALLEAKTAGPFIISPSSLPTAAAGGAPSEIPLPSKGTDKP